VTDNSELFTVPQFSSMTEHSFQGIHFLLKKEEV
jgi:hypothetical protein